MHVRCHSVYAFSMVVRERTRLAIEARELEAKVELPANSKKIDTVQLVTPVYWSDLRFIEHSFLSGNQDNENDDSVYH